MTTINHTVAKQVINGQYPVIWTFYPDKNLHIVQYGAEVRCTNDSIDAAKEFGYCLHHAAECAGLLDR